MDFEWVLPYFYIHIPSLGRQSPYILGLYICTDQDLDWYRCLVVFPFSQAENDQLFRQRQWDVNLKAPAVGFAVERKTSQVL